MSMEEKLDALTKETVALRKAVEANTAALGGTAPAGAAAAAKKAPAKKAPAKKEVEADEPEHDADEVEEKFKEAARLDIDACKAYLKKVKQKKLADLLTDPSLYDDAFEFAEGVIDGAEDGEDDEDDI